MKFINLWMKFMIIEDLFNVIISYLDKMEF